MADYQERVGSFYARTDASGTLHEVHFLLYEDHADFTQDVEDFDQRINPDTTQPPCTPDVLGETQHYPTRIRVPAAPATDVVVVYRRITSVIRLYLPQLTTLILMHECVHAALEIFCRDHELDKPEDVTAMLGGETIPTIASDLYGTAYRGCYDLGFLLTEKRPPAHVDDHPGLEVSPMPVALRP